MNKTEILSKAYRYIFTIGLVASFILQRLIYA